MELPFPVLPVTPYFTKLEGQVLSIWTIRTETCLHMESITVRNIPDKHEFIYSPYMLIGLYDDSGKVLLLILIEQYHFIHLSQYMIRDRIREPLQIMVCRLAVGKSDFQLHWSEYCLSSLYSRRHPSIYIAENISRCIHTKNITMLVSARIVNNPYKPDPPMHHLCILECVITGY